MRQQGREGELATGVSALFAKIFGGRTESTRSRTVKRTSGPTRTIGRPTKSAYFEASEEARDNAVPVSALTLNNLCDRSCRAAFRGALSPDVYILRLRAVAAGDDNENVFGLIGNGDYAVAREV